MVVFGSMSVYGFKLRESDIDFFCNKYIRLLVNFFIILVIFIWCLINLVVFFLFNYNKVLVKLVMVLEVLLICDIVFLFLLFFIFIMWYKSFILFFIIVIGVLSLWLVWFINFCFCFNVCFMFCRFLWIIVVRVFNFL